MKRYVLCIICVATAFQLASGVSAALTGSYTVCDGPWQFPTEYRRNPWIANLWFSDDAVRPDIVLFNGSATTPVFPGNGGIDVGSNAGKTFWIASDKDDPKFSSVVSLLTSDVPAYAWINISVGFGGLGYPIPMSFLRGSPTWDESINNFHGYNIERIGLTITSASHTIDPQSGDDIYSSAVTCTVEYTPVPEPASFVVLVAGIAGMCGLRYRSRRDTRYIQEPVRKEGEQ